MVQPRVLPLIAAAFAFHCGGQTATSVSQDRGDEDGRTRASNREPSPDAGRQSGGAAGGPSSDGKPASPTSSSAGPDAIEPEPTADEPSGRAEPEPTAPPPEPSPGPELEPEPSTRPEPEPSSPPEPNPEPGEPPDGGTSDPSELATALQRYWSIGGFIGQVGEEETFWHFFDEGSFEYVRLANYAGDGLTLERHPGSYSLEGRTLSFQYAYQRHRLDVAVSTLDDRPVLMRHVYTPVDATRWRTEFVEESTLEDGTVWRGDTVASELEFDAPIAAEGAGACAVRVDYEVVHFELQDATGQDLPEEEQTTVQSGTSDWVACSYEPTERGQRIVLEAWFASDTDELPPIVERVLRGSPTLLPEDPEVLYLNTAFGRDELPEVPFGP